MAKYKAQRVDRKLINFPTTLNKLELNAVIAMNFKKCEDLKALGRNGDANSFKRRALDLVRWRDEHDWSQGQDGAEDDV